MPPKSPEPVDAVGLRSRGRLFEMKTGLTRIGFPSPPPVSCPNWLFAGAKRDARITRISRLTQMAQRNAESKFRRDKSGLEC
jgi:hypothetical protein